MIRLHYDTARWQVQIGHGRSGQAGGAATRDYVVSNVAFNLAGQRWTTKLEWTCGRDLQGMRGWDERVVLLRGGYRLGPQLDLVTRHYAGENTVTGSKTRLTNTYLGLTAQLADIRRWRARVQVNYVAGGGDGAGYTGLRGFRDDALFL